MPFIKSPSEDNILVKPFGGEEMPSIPVTVSTSVYGDDELPELKVGMQVRMMLSGQARDRTVLAIRQRVYTPFL